MEPTARYEELKIPLSEPVHGLESVSAVLGIPEWWPTGSRVGVVLAHGAGSAQANAILERLHRGLTERGHLTLRFKFPFAEAGKRRTDKPAVLEAVMRDVVAFIGRDPTAAPAHLFLGGLGLGGRVAAQVSRTRLRVEGLFFMGYPLHPARKPEEVEAESLYRLITPILFLQGTRDRYCDLDVLRKTLFRVGAPTTLHVVQEADHQLKVLKKSGRSEEDVAEEVTATLEKWIAKVLEGG